MRCVRLITLLFFLYVDYLSLFCTSSFAVRAHSGSRPFTNALQRLIESAASWSDDYCYVCLWYSYTQDRPSVQMLDLISREVPLNRYVDYRDIHRDVVCSFSPNIRLQIANLFLTFFCSCATPLFLYPLYSSFPVNNIHGPIQDSAISGRKYDKILPSIGGFQVS